MLNQASKGNKTELYTRALSLAALLGFCLWMGLGAGAQRVSAQGALPEGNVAPKPLFRDPKFDGAADPTLIWNRKEGEWWMFYTNRRANLTGAEAVTDPKDVSWMHGTHIGIAVSRDNGATWLYHGVAKIKFGKKDYTQWAPDIVYDHGKYHMFLVVVPGTFKDWNAPRYIEHFVSSNLERWHFVGRVDTGSDRIIDPTLIHVKDSKGSDNLWRMWYKDELDKSHIYYADSVDLNDWKPKGAAITDRSSEGPKVFRWKQQNWMIVDSWKGLSVYRSSGPTDFVHWTPQPDNILETPGHQPTDRNEGHHCDVVVSEGSAFIFYFTHQMGADLDKSLAFSERRTVIQVAELHESDGVITVDRDAPTHVYLAPVTKVKPNRLHIRLGKWSH
jgi:hypothetical protein